MCYIRVAKLNKRAIKNRSSLDSLDQFLRVPKETGERGCEKQTKNRSGEGSISKVSRLSSAYGMRITC